MAPPKDKKQTKDKDTKGFTKVYGIKKQTFLAKMKATLGNITASCQSAGISRRTYYDWIEADPDFKQAVDDINEESIDFAESSLKQQIKDGDTTATIFYLKTKGKKRGYVEKTETESIVKAEVKTEDSDFDLLTDDEKDEIVRKIQDAKHARYMEQHYGKTADTNDNE